MTAPASPRLSQMQKIAEDPITMDVSAAPYDLRPIADQAAQRILAAKESAPDTPIIMPMGEHHNIPVTSLMQSAVLAACLREGLTPSFGYEDTCLVVHDMIEDHLIDDPDTAEMGEEFFDLINFIVDAAVTDENGNAGILAKAVAEDETPASREVMRFCRDHHIKTSFNDAAMYDDCFDDNDPATVLAIEALGYDIDLIHSMCRGGVHVRNAMMAQGARNQYDHEKPDVIIHMMGIAHIWGDNKIWNFPVAESFTLAAQKQGFKTLPVGFTRRDWSCPQDADKTGSIMITGWEDVPSFFPPNHQKAGASIKTIYEQSAGLVPYTDVISATERTAAGADFNRWITAQKQHFMKTL